MSRQHLPFIFSHYLPTWGFNILLAFNLADAMSDGKPAFWQAVSLLTENSVPLVTVLGKTKHSVS